MINNFSLVKIRSQSERSCPDAYIDAKRRGKRTQLFWLNRVVESVVKSSTQIPGSKTMRMSESKPIIAPDTDITRLLIRWGRGESTALNEIVPAVYAELRRIAHLYMRRQRAGNSLQTTALVNEAYLRLVDSDKVNWHDRNHFFAICSQLMRRILVDRARRRSSQKRGGDRLQITLAEEIAVLDQKQADVVALDEALRRLAEMSPRQSQIVELRYFGGLTEDQVADALGISSRTVRRDWNVARAWLFRELERGN